MLQLAQIYFPEFFELGLLDAGLGGAGGPFARKASGAGDGTQSGRNYHGWNIRPPLMPPQFRELKQRSNARRACGPPRLRCKHLRAVDAR